MRPNNLRLEHIETGTQYRKWRVLLNGIQRGFIEEGPAPDPLEPWEATGADGVTVVASDAPLSGAVTAVIGGDVLVPEFGTFDPATGELVINFNTTIAAATGVDGFAVNAGSEGVWSQTAPIDISAGVDQLTIAMTKDADTAPDNTFAYTKAGADAVSEDGDTLPDFSSFPLEII